MKQSPADNQTFFLTLFCLHGHTGILSLLTSPDGIRFYHIFCYSPENRPTIPGKCFRTSHCTAVVILISFNTLSDTHTHTSTRTAAGVFCCTIWTSDRQDSYTCSECRGLTARFASELLDTCTTVLNSTWGVLLSKTNEQQDSCTHSQHQADPFTLKYR